MHRSYHVSSTNLCIKKTAIRRGNVVYVHTPHPSPTPILYFSSFLKEGWGEIGGRRAKGTSGEDDEEEVGDGMGRILSGMGRRKERVSRVSRGGRVAQIGGGISVWEKHGN